MHILGLRRIASERTEEKYHIGECNHCRKKSTFTEQGYCNNCGSLFSLGQEVSYDIYETFRIGKYAETYLELDYVPKIPDEIIKDLTKKGEPAPVYKPKNNTQKINSNLKKQNFMKKSINKIGNTIANGTCKVLGGAHLVVQTSADLIVVTEALIKEKQTGKAKEETIKERKIKTAETQVKVCLTAIEKAEQAKEKTKELKNRLTNLFTPANVETIEIEAN